MKKISRYEFIRNDFTGLISLRSFDMRVIAEKIKESLGSTNVERDEDYVESHDCFIESTMSCTKEEAIKWMKYYMANAIAYGITNRNLDWKMKFLAAYDIFNSLIESKYLGTYEIRFF